MRFQVAEDGSRVAFLRSRAGDDPVAALWVFDVTEGRERLVFDQADAGGELTRAELDRRERAGERLEGVTGYAADRNATVAAFALGGRLMLADLVNGGARELEGSAPGAFDPRIDPTGRRIAYIADGALHVHDLETGEDLDIAADPDPDVSWGLAEFVAAEEMERSRAFWWAPDGDAIAAARVDERDVLTWHIADLLDPAKAPRAVRYPKAGTANASVSLHVLGLDGSRADAQIDVDAFPYLVNVSWNKHGPLLAWIQSRDQKHARVVGVDRETGAITVLREDRDERWIHILTGVPAWLPGGRLLHSSDRHDTRRLEIDGEPVTPGGLQVHAVSHVDGDVVFLGTREPTELHVWRLTTGGDLIQLTTDPGVHSIAGGGRVAVITSETIDASLPVSSVVADGSDAGESLASFAEEPLLSAQPTFFTVGERELRAALFTPDGREPDRPLPVLLDPYGGPHFGKVVRAQRYHRESQWWADQGFAVLVADGRGTPNRGTGWERAIHLDVAAQVLEDQVDALQGAAKAFGFLDLERVAIRGWSFGGYLACLAVLRRPEVFHVGVAGAPSADWSLYDTHYTERYIGHPTRNADVYAANSALTDAPKLERPLLLIHGMTDDNVFVANTLAMSKALMEAGRPHAVLPLSGITHRPVDERLAENLLLLELGFFRQALSLPN
jgi:dipeptidyl-peptidase 4